MATKVADAIVETLQSAGVKRCYGIVGDTLNDVAHSIQKSGIRFVHMRHEEAGAFAAGAVAGAASTSNSVRAQVPFTERPGPPRGRSGSVKSSNRNAVMS